MDFDISAIKQSLKEKYIDRDDIIDQLVDNVAVWKEHPELINKPMIINLWGNTGTGKTSLIENILEMFKINGSTLRLKSLSVYVEDFLVDIFSRKNREVVIFIDEIQKMASRDMMGGYKNGSSDNNFWDFIDTGKIPMNFTKSKILNTITRLERAVNPNKEIDPKTGEVRLPLKEARSSYDNVYHMVYLGYQKTIEEFRKEYDSEAKLLQAYVERYAEKGESTEYIDVSNCLILTSGNLNNVIPEAFSVNRVDTDADFVYEYTKNVSIFDIKRGLLQFFHPEHISRLGNRHILFPTFSKDGYRTLIDRLVESVINQVKTINSVELTVTEEFKNMIYRNNVYPAQGARPVQSGVNSALINNIVAILEMIGEDKTATIDYDFASSAILVNGEKLEFVAEIDELIKKKNALSDIKLNTSAHEIGHAIVFAKLFGVAPAYVVTALPDDSFAAGYMLPIAVRTTKRYMKYQLAVGLAGLAAETIIFGSEDRTSGSSADLKYCTNLASKMVRELAMGKTIGVTIDGTNFNADIDGRNSEIELLLSEAYQLAEKIIVEEKKLFMKLVETLNIDNKITSEQFVQVAADCGMELVNKKVTDVIYHQYESAYEKWCKAEESGTMEPVTEGYQFIVRDRTEKKEIEVSNESVSSEEFTLMSDIFGEDLPSFLIDEK